ncbi:MAG: FTR1 family protein [Chloroflexota bacterium]
MIHSICRSIRFWLAALLVMGAMIVGLRPVSAQATEPWNAADSVRRSLFTAEMSVLSGESGDVSQVNAAIDMYTHALKPQISAAAPDVAQTLDDALNAALSTTQKGDALGLAVARSQVWTGLVHGSTRVIMQAITSGDTTTADQWLQLRDFRTSTKFSRPGGDSLLALNALIAGQANATDTLATVRVDLLDTYQAKLNEALVNADNAQQQDFGQKQVEQSALAAGYFDLLTDPKLSTAFLTLRGQNGIAASQETFKALVTAALNRDAANYHTVRSQVDSALKDFRVAPLSDAEQVRRAGQLAQFVALVSVEYGRGVVNGKVIKDLEIQEALTFRDGANAAFSDLQTILDVRDPVATARVATLLSTLKTQIMATVDPSVVDSTVNDISKTLTTLYPASWQTLNSGSDFDVISSILDQIEPAVKQGMYAQAESARLQAYAILDSGIEQKLRGFAPDLAVRVESLFWQGDGKQVGLSVLIANNASPAEINAGLVALRTALTESQTFLGGAKTAPLAVAGNAAVIVFREGLEAVLILASLIASMRTVESKKFRRPVFFGAALALIVSGITWWVANSLLMSLIKYGEKLSVIVGLIAIGVLLLITNWFFHKTYWVGWMANFHKQKSRILGGTLVLGPSVGLILLGFTSIYREGFETVLFLQSLVLDSGITTVLLGVIMGLVATGIIGLIVFGLQVRLPAKQMLIVTGIFIGVVLLTMVGNTVHAAQSVGWLPITPIAGLYIPYWMGQWFGLFTTWQSVVLQFIAAAFVIGSYVLAERMNSQKRTQKGGKITQDTAERAPDTTTVAHHLQ